MPSTEQLRSRLLKKLRELFQLDQPDLDFGFYRIMHAKSAEVQEFIDKDLLCIVEEAFVDSKGSDSARKLEETKEKLISQLGEAAINTDGSLSEMFAATPIGKEYFAALKNASGVEDTAGSEADVYAHLYRFFERYYEDGDFISRRYYTRETSGKAAPFAIPYNGEEIKLHWANADQYYIKTAEYFSNFTFNLLQSAEIQKMSPEKRVLYEIPDGALRVHFRIAEANEGEHGNVKASEANKRFFLIHAEKPVDITEGGELVINFEYRPDPEKVGRERIWRDKRNAEAVETVLGKLEEMITHETHEIPEKENQEENFRDLLKNYLRLMKIPAPTEKDKKRPMLARYVNQYTARNTMDYFIHKDLGSFLRRELDFYIKNEVMRLDDIENADAPAVESYLARIRVLRKIAGKLIDFLAQLEDFQKKLWLKKKFVVSTDYCVTLDRVPDELYPEIVANEAQHEEWVKLFAIDDIEADLSQPGYARPLTSEFLKANNKLVLDTRFFGKEFKARLLAFIENFDEQCDGLLIHSENFQALNLLQDRYREQVKCVYIDPPYNTGKDGFPYKDSYQHSSWITMITERIARSRSFVKQSGVFFISIDEKEHHNLKNISDWLFGNENQLADFVWLAEGNFDNQAKIKMAHEYILSYAISELNFAPPPVVDPSITGSSKLFRSEIRNTIVKNGPKNPISSITLPEGFPTAFESGIVKKSDSSWPKYNVDIIVKNFSVQNTIVAKSGWSSKTLYEDFINNGMMDIPDSKGQVTSFVLTHTGAIESVKKRDKKQSYVTSIIKSVGTIQSTKAMLANMSCSYPHYPKPPQLISYVASMANVGNQVVLDYFAGSGTTGHAVINLNREDNGKRKYILVEMGEHFDTVLKPRITKVVYSESWKDGKPTSRHTGISHCFKYLRLESYEDTLNNLRFDDNPTRKKAIAANASLKEDYMLRYLLDVETRGSQSLLNIDAFADPTAYTLKVKKPGSDEYTTQNIDLIETFNYLIGFRVLHIAAPQEFTAEFKRVEDPEVPEDQQTKLVLDGRLKLLSQETREPLEKEDKKEIFRDFRVVRGLHLWWFRKLEGWVPADPANPDNGQREKVLIVWRRLTGDPEKDNLMLDEWFEKNRISTRDFEFDLIYVNGSNNLPNLQQEGDTWKVRLIEEEFMKRMWNVEGV